MKSIFVAALLAVTPLSVAQDIQWYGHGSAMYVVPQDTELSTMVGDVTEALEFAADDGFGFLAAVGYGQDTGLRGEIEFSFREVTIDDVQAGVYISRDQTSLGLFGSLYYVTDIGYHMRPYCGAGLGVVQHRIDTNFGDSDDNAIGWQGMAGVILPFEAAEIRIGYRYMATEDWRVFAPDNSRGEGGLDASYGAHNFEVGFSLPF